MYLFPADIVFFQSSDLLGRLIRKFTRNGAEPRSETNHCGIVTHAGYLLDKKLFPVAWIVEALHKTKHHALIKAYSASGVRLLIYRPKNLTFEEKHMIRQKALTYVGRTYGYLKLVAHALDYFLGGKSFFRKLAHIDKWPICSYLVSMSYGSIDKDFGVQHGAATPDDILDFCQAHPDKYERIFGWGEIV